MCGAAFLGNVWGAIGPPIGPRSLACGTLACLAWRRWRARGDPARRPSTRPIAVLLVAVACALRATPPAQIDDIGEIGDTSDIGSGRGLSAGGRREGRWQPLGSAYGETRGALGARLETYQLDEGVAAAGETLGVSVTGSPVLRAQPPRAMRARTTYLRHPQVAWVRVAPDELERIGGAPRSPLDGWRRAADRLRAAGLARARGLESEGTRNLFGALLFGERGGWSAGAADLFARTGTRHVLSLSGLHVGLMSWLVAQPLGVLLAYGIGRLARLAGVRRSCSPVLLQALLVWLFVPLAGGNPPVVRAAWALTLAQFARWIPVGGARRGRRPRTLSLWCFALLLECIADARAPLELSVQLSYAATLGLIVGYGGARRHLARAAAACLPLRETGTSGRRRSPWLRVPLVKLGSVAVSSTAASLAAVIATLPIVWVNFGEWSPWGLVAMPLVLPPLTFFMGCASLWLVLPSAGLRSCVEHSAHWLLGLLELLDTLPGTPAQLPPRPFGLLVALAVALLTLLARSTPVRDPRRPGPGGRARWLARTTALGLGAVWLPWRAAPRTLELVLLEVGHGTALLARAPGEACWIFDAGSSDRPSIARDAIAPVLRHWETAEVHLALSHDHRDHTSSLAWLTERWPPTLWAGSTCSALPDRATRLDLPSGRMRLPAQAQHLSLDLLRGDAGRGNEGSRSLELRFAGETLLLCGDAEAAGLARLLRDGELGGPLRLLLLPHHGTAGREVGSLLEHTAPRQVWVSRGSEFPARSLVEARGIPWRSTAQGPLQIALEPPAKR